MQKYAAKLWQKYTKNYSRKRKEALKKACETEQGSTLERIEKAADNNVKDYAGNVGSN